MRFQSVILGVFALGLAHAAPLQGLSYEDSINALANGNADLQGEKSGDVYLNIEGFAQDKLPHIQNDLGVTTLDNFDSLKSIAALAQIAAQKSKWGDLVFLYNAFSMNAHGDYIKVTSDQMESGLLESVTGADGGKPDQALIDLYSSTSSSQTLADAFNNLKTKSGLEKKWFKEVCSSAHQAAKSACRALIQNVSVNVTVKAGGPRNICKSGCCISWSANATFQVRNLTSAASYCVNACGSTNVSCEVFGVNLSGTILDQCLSNRPNGCK